MSKKKKKRNSSQASAAATPAENVKKRLKGFNWSRLLILILSTLILFTIYEALLTLEEQNQLGYSITRTVFFIAATLLTCAVIFLNHGTTRQEITPEMLSTDLTPEEAARVCERLNRHKSLARRLMYPLIPLLFTLLLDIFYLFWGDTLRQIFSVFTGS